MKNQLKILSISILLLVGCAALPPSMHKDITPPHQTRSGLKISNQARDLSQLKWWKKLHDPVLNQLITEALAHNNQIKTAQANILQAEASLKAAHFAWLPTLSVAANGFIGETVDTHFTPRGFLAQNPALAHMGNLHFKGYNSGFVPSYSLNILKNIYSDKLAQSTLTMQTAAYQSMRLSTISQISGAYFMLLGQREQCSLQIQLTHDLKKIRHLEFIRYHDGANDLSTVTQIDKQIANNKANLTSIKSSISQLENAIHILLNQNPGPIATQGKINRLSVDKLIPANVPSLVLKNRPDVVMAESNLKISLANLGIAYSQFFPSISLTSSIGGASLDLSHLLKLNTGLLVAEAAASMPLLNGVAYEQVNAAKASTQAAYFTYVQTLRTVFADVDDSLTNQQQKNEAYHDQLTALHAAQSTYNLAKARYDAGAKDQREVLNAKLTLDYAKLDANTAKMQQLDSVVEVYQALAGGYL